MRLGLDCDEPLPCTEVGFYPVDTQDSLKGCIKDSDISSAALCFKTFPPVADMETSLLTQDAWAGLEQRGEVTRASPWAQRKELPNTSSHHRMGQGGAQK